MANVGANWVWLNQGDGTFIDNGQRLGTNTSAHVALGDFDLDGDLDALAANYHDQPDQIWWNDGNGEFVAGPELEMNVSSNVAIGDVDRDGDLDAVVAAYSASQSNVIWINDVRGASAQAAGSYDAPTAVLDHEYLSAAPSELQEATRTEATIATENSTNWFIEAPAGRAVRSHAIPVENAALATTPIAIAARASRIDRDLFGVQQGRYEFAKRTDLRSEIREAVFGEDGLASIGRREYRLQWSGVDARETVHDRDEVRPETVDQIFEKAFG